MAKHASKETAKRTNYTPRHVPPPKRKGSHR